MQGSITRIETPVGNLMSVRSWSFGIGSAV